MANLSPTKQAPRVTVAPCPPSARRMRKRELEALVEFVSEDDPILVELVARLESHLAFHA
jgi:hypothetical protein